VRRRLAAAFVVFHVLAVVVLSVPRPPPGLRNAQHRQRHTEAILARWADGAEQLGLSRRWVIDRAHVWLPAWNRLLGAVRAPFEPYASLTGAEQSWLMFGSVPANAARVEIDVRVDGEWVPLYRPQSSTASWNARLLRQERMRAEIHRYSRRGHRVGFRALADRLAAGFGPPVPIGRAPAPPGDRLRVRMQAVAVPDPATLEAEGSLRLGAVYWTEERPL
jgi:hypothetical protein